MYSNIEDKDFTNKDRSKFDAFTASGERWYLEQRFTV